MRRPLLTPCLGLPLLLFASAAGAPQDPGGGGEVGERAAVPADPADAPAVGLEAGQLLPDLELMRVDGTDSVRLSELRGRRVLLLVFASW